MIVNTLGSHLKIGIACFVAILVLRGHTPFGQHQESLPLGRSSRDENDASLSNDLWWIIWTSLIECPIVLSWWFSRDIVTTRALHYWHCSDFRHCVAIKDTIWPPSTLTYWISNESGIFYELSWECIFCGGSICSLELTFLLFLISNQKMDQPFKGKIDSFKFRTDQDE